MGGSLLRCAYSSSKWQLKVGVRTLRLFLCTGFLFSLPTGSLAQNNAPRLEAKRFITLQAVLPSSVNLSPRSVGLDIVRLRDGGDEYMLRYSLEAEWNLDPSIQQVQLIAFFEDGRNAMRDGAGHFLNAADLELTVDGSGWKAFPERIETHSSSGLLLSSMKVSGIGHKGKKAYQLEVRIRPGASTSLATRYSGMLHFRAVLQ